MADVEELRNLATHAAQLLKGAGPERLMDTCYTVGQSQDVRSLYGRQVTGAIAAMAYAAGILEMVAACMSTEDGGS